MSKEMDYEDFYNASWGDIPTKKLLPSGGWVLEGASAGFAPPKEKGKPAKVLFFYQPVEPVEGAVDEDDYAALGDDYDYSLNEMAYTVFIESPKDWIKVRKHLEAIGLETDGQLFDSNKKLAFAKAFKGHRVVGDISVRTYENNHGETVIDNAVSKFAQVAE